ncbi:protein of unassigned function [Methylobacterium oryzae CBMB20]|uniref:Protein of unassigned function n=1 Tax=Methylobacterium oryzae CBMB20 TaxID=693986 RepID=A0A089NXX4_9HYPH|nr:protein of unassigned function [Methylobacterium oryzae CBMB20]
MVASGLTAPGPDLQVLGPIAYRISTFTASSAARYTFP